VAFNCWKRSFLVKLFADSAYQGSKFGNALAKILPGLITEIVKRPNQAKGFVKLPKRWIVERTIAWLNRCRRLAKDWENLNRNALAFLKLSSIRLMLTQLSQLALQNNDFGVSQRQKSESDQRGDFQNRL
jgi:transposase